MRYLSSTHTPILNFDSMPNEPNSEDKMKAWIRQHHPMPNSSFLQYLSIINKYRREQGDDCSYDSLIKFVLATNPKTGMIYTSAVQRKVAITLYYEYMDKKDIIRKAQEDGIFKRIKLPKALIHPKVFSSDDFKLDSDGKFTSEFYDNFRNFLDNLEPDSRMLMMVLWDTASRISPILRLRKKDLRYNSDGTAEFYITAKGGGKYKLYLSLETTKAIKKYSEQMKDDHLLFFRDIPIKKDYKIRDKAKLSYGSYYMELKHKSAKAELVSPDYGISPHWIRAAKAHYVYKMEGNDILAAKAFLHHASITTTERYLTSSDEELAKELAMKQKNEKW